MFVKRDGNGVIIEATRWPTEENQEHVENDDANLLHFMKAEAQDDLDALKEIKIQEVKDSFGQYMSSFTGGYPMEEMLSWDRQNTEAEEYEADNNAPAKMIRKLSDQRGVAMGELSLRIRKKAASYKFGSGLLIGERQRCEDAVALAVDAAEVDAVVFTVPADFLAQVQAEADAVVS